MYLLDTAIVCELRKARTGQTDAGLIGWARGVPASSLFISAISLLEIEAGVAQAERRDKTASEGLRAWADTTVLKAFDGRILPVDAAVVKRRAQISLPDPRDALMAATALVHGLTLVTRNTSAFKSSRVKLFNPWGYRPDEAAEDNADWREGTRTGPMWFRNLFLRF
ncbi:MAG: PIN domain-containing protein [Asticcacaulis sp.]